jgi:hypothetical protein
LRITPWKDCRFNLQIGKFPTVVGDWVARHLSWDNPFVNAPLPYETASLVSDVELPLTGNSFRRVPGFDKYEFLPILWGPVYATGMSAAGRIGIFEYAIEVKNSPFLPTRAWDEINLDHPGRRFAHWCSPTRWRFDFRSRKARTFPRRAITTTETLGDYRQFSLQDSVGRGHWQVWADVQSRFECRAWGPTFSPTTLKYQISHNFFGALRWNGIFVAMRSRRPAGRDRGDVSRSMPRSAIASPPHTVSF